LDLSITVVGVFIVCVFGIPTETRDHNYGWDSMIYHVLVETRHEPYKRGHRLRRATPEPGMDGGTKVCMVCTSWEGLTLEEWEGPCRCWVRR
jgi:hypothetical protein